MMMVYSLSLCFMPQYDCCVFNVGLREGGALGSFAGLFQSLTALASKSVVHSGFCLASLGVFLLAQAEICLVLFFAFLGLGEAAAAILQLLFEVNWTVQFWSKISENKCQEKNWPGLAGGRGCSFLAPDLGKNSSWAGKAHLLHRGTNTRDSPCSHLFAPVTV